MGCIQAGRRGKLIKMEALQNTGTHPRLKSSLNIPPIPRRTRYQTRHHDGAGRGWYKRYMKSILWCVHNAVMRWKWLQLITDPHEVRMIVECLKRNKAPPFDKVALKASWFFHFLTHQWKKKYPGVRSACPYLQKWIFILDRMRSSGQHVYKKADVFRW